MKLFIYSVIFVLSTLIFISCDDASSEKLSGIAVNPRVSECGGFTDVKKIVKATTEEATCNDVLNWTYNDKNKTISFQNDNVGLNCCGAHSINVVLEDGKYIITEVDNSEDGMRCNCMCTFSFAVDIENIESNPINIILKRNIEEEGISTVLDTSIDTTQSSGSILVQEQNGFVCGVK
jgi:hypothetical protein